MYITSDLLKPDSKIINTPNNKTGKLKQKVYQKVSAREVSSEK